MIEIALSIALGQKYFTPPAFLDKFDGELLAYRKDGIASITKGWTIDIGAKRRPLSFSYDPLKKWLYLDDQSYSYCIDIKHHKLLFKVSALHKFWATKGRLLEIRGDLFYDNGIAECIVPFVDNIWLFWGPNPTFVATQRGSAPCEWWLYCYNGNRFEKSAMLLPDGGENAHTRYVTSIGDRTFVGLGENVDDPRYVFLYEIRNYGGKSSVQRVYQPAFVVGEIPRLDHDGSLIVTGRNTKSWNNQLLRIRDGVQKIKNVAYVDCFPDREAKCTYFLYRDGHITKTRLK